MERAPGTYKGQPWILFDTVSAKSFLLGDTTNGLADGTQSPAISNAGEMVFFSTPRTRAIVPQLTNLDVPGQLAYGMEAWQMYLHISFPIVTPNQNLGWSQEVQAGVAPGLKLAEAILNHSTMELGLGQEEQTYWPVHRYGAGGGLYVTNGVANAYVQNSFPQDENVMKMPEAIEMIRTQNLFAKLRIDPQVHQLIGSEAAPGVGGPLDDYVLGIDEQTTADLPQPPYKVQFGIIGRRVKKSQYGQIPPGSTGE